MHEHSPADHPVRAAWDELEAALSEAPAIELTILMPCLNESETLGVCIDKARAFLDRSGVSGEIVIADNGSEDGSREIARAHGARVVPIAARGYGAALIGGIAAARGRFVIMGDSDDSYDFSQLDAFVAKLREGCDLVMGNRFKGGIAQRAMPPLHRYLGNPVLSFVGRLFFRSDIGDFHCGLRGFSREAIERLRLTSPGMEFASEMVVKATVAGLRVAEVPTTLSPDGRSRAPHLRSWRDGWRHLKLLLTYAPDWLFLYPGAAFAAMGGLLVAALLPGPLTLGRMTLDNATLVFAVAAVLVGMQMLMFYLVARSHATAEGMLPAGAAPGPAEWSVDRLCLLGGLLFAAGFATALAATLWWMTQGFGALDPSVIVRFAAVSTLGMALGVQVVTGGFLLGLVRSRTERDRAAPPRSDDAAEARSEAPPVRTAA